MADRANQQVGAFVASQPGGMPKLPAGVIARWQVTPKTRRGPPDSVVAVDLRATEWVAGPRSPGTCVPA